MEARNTIKEVYRFIEYTATIMGYSNADDFVKTQIKTDCPAAWLRSICEQAVESGEIEPPEFLRNAIFYDPWGRPMNIAWRSSVVQKGAERLLHAPMELLVWSSGENGRNEYGSGDDVVPAHQPWRIGAALENSK